MKSKYSRISSAHVAGKIICGDGPTFNAWVVNIREYNKEQVLVRTSAVPIVFN